MEHFTETSRLTKKQRRFFSAGIIVLFGLFMGFLFYFVGRPMLEFVSEPEKFRAWVDGRAMLSRFAFVGMVVFQVVIAIIPGEPLEIGAGYAFGAIEGTLLCILGFAIGSALIFALVHTLGVRLVEVFFPIEKIKSLKFLRNTKRLNTLTFIIFLIPGTPKDLLCYFVGLTDMSFRNWMIIATLARIPSVLTSTVGGNALGNQNYKIAIIVLAVTLLISGIGLIIYKAICAHHNRSEKTNSNRSGEK